MIPRFSLLHFPDVYFTSGEKKKQKNTASLWSILAIDQT